MRRRALLTFCLAALGVILLVIASSSSPVRARSGLKIKIDWQPSPEYYGLYYARDLGFYRDAGFDVEIVPGSGAPQAAAEIGSGRFVMGTTTSDNILRLMGRKAEFSRLVAVLKFNPSVVVSLKSSGIRHLRDLEGKRLGTNPSASYYTQLLYVLRKPSIAAAGIIEDASIGFGGIRQLRERSIDAMLAYTTNAVVDLQADGIEVEEIFLGREGAESYGVVLAVASANAIRQAGLTDADVDRIIAATLRGYRVGGQDINRSVRILTREDPTIGLRKAELAIAKIGTLNSITAYAPERLDRWVEGVGVTEELRSAVLKLYR